MSSPSIPMVPLLRGDGTQWADRDSSDHTYYLWTTAVPTSPPIIQTGPSTSDLAGGIIHSATNIPFEAISPIPYVPSDFPPIHPAMSPQAGGSSMPTAGPPGIPGPSSSFSPTSDSSLPPDTLLRILEQMTRNMQVQSEMNSRPRTSSSESWRILRALGSIEKFDGTDRSKLPDFLTSLERHFSSAPGAFPYEASKINYAITHLTGDAGSWANETFPPEILVERSYSGNPFSFQTMIESRFGMAVRRVQVESELLALRQDKTLLEYDSKFSRLANQLGPHKGGFGDAALKAIYRFGLKSQLQNQLAQAGGYENMNLHELQSKAGQLDALWESHQTSRNRSSDNSSSHPKKENRAGGASGQTYIAPVPGARVASGPVPMDIDAATRERFCYKCLRTRHVANECPNERMPDHLRPPWFRAYEEGRKRNMRVNYVQLDNADQTEANATDGELNLNAALLSPEEPKSASWWPLGGI